MDNNKIEKILDSFGVKAKLKEVVIGPTITRLGLELSPGIKIATITNLEENIALALGRTAVRVSGPIPKKSLIGIEIPNEERKLIKTLEIIPEVKGILPVTFGVCPITGKTKTYDLTKMPHLLIAGATGTGKSVLINTLIYSLISKCSPMEVKFIMVDPKMVELSVYNGIPHLLTPVVTEPTFIGSTLEWILKEMKRRYSLLEKAKVRNLKNYNASRITKLPYIVVVMDEFADLMAVAKKEVEHSVQRLAAMGRATGIHLILATQRPSVDVITGIIKANFVARVALQVASKVDSRTILDKNGAEALLGKGDMLYQNGITLERVQGGFISEEEIDAYLEKIRVDKPSYQFTIQELENLVPNTTLTLLDKAITFVAKEQKLSMPNFKKNITTDEKTIEALLHKMEELHIISGNEVLIKEW